MEAVFQVDGTPYPVTGSPAGVVTERTNCRGLGGWKSYDHLDTSSPVLSDRAGRTSTICFWSKIGAPPL
jgi:hypothetical protein